MSSAPVDPPKNDKPKASKSDDSEPGQKRSSSEKFSDAPKTEKNGEKKTVVEKATETCTVADETKVKNNANGNKAPLPSPSAAVGAKKEKKASKYCIFEGCMKYRQSGTFGYCLTHKSHADPAKVAAAKARLSKPVTKLAKGKRSRKSFEAAAIDAESRRRSDRLHAMRRELNSLLGKVEPSTDDGRIVALKLDKLEKLMGDDDFKAEYFAIAGSKLFEPTGSLSLSDTKRLGRNAGSIRIPTLKYDSAYEVAETTHCHHWRKKTIECSTYEELIHSLRFLDSHLDNGVSVSYVMYVVSLYRPNCRSLVL